MSDITAATPSVRQYFTQRPMFIIRDPRHRGPVGVLNAWLARRHYRSELRRLLTLEPRLIADIGLSLDEARKEIVLPFWRE